MATLTPEAALRALLIADVTYNAIVDGRVWPRSDVPQGQSRPYATQFRVSRSGDHNLLAASGLPMVRVQWEHWSIDYDETRTMGSAAREALDGFRGTVTSGADSLAVALIKLDDESSVFDIDVPGRNRKISGLRQDYMIHFTETIPTF